MVDFKNISGLSEPIKRLIEVVAEGVGGISRSLLARKNAEDKAYKIRTITEAMIESQKLLGPAKYENGQIVIRADEKDDGQLPDADIEKRLLTRITYQETKRQINLENITQYAAENFDGSEEIGPDRPDRDWAARFFRIAEDITTEPMQELWGKVLAGEIKRPGSFSLRTIDTLKNISQKEAEVFAKLARIAVKSDNTIFVPHHDRDNYLEDKFNIGFVDLLLLREIGLIAPNILEFSLQATEKARQEIFTIGSLCILVDRPAKTPKQPVPVVIFTDIGKQLVKLVKREPPPPHYVENFASYFQTKGVVVKCAGITGWIDEHRFSHSQLYEVPGNKPFSENR